MPENSHFTKTRGGPSGRFSLLLVSIILSFALRPFLEGFVKISILSDIFFSVILLSAIQAVAESKRNFAAALVLAVTYLLLKWSTYVLDAPVIEDLCRILGALLTAYVLIFILIFILKQKEVTGEVIMAAVCGYFFIGLMWAFIFFFLETVHPGSFQISLGQRPDFEQFTYFSFVTMTTLGYGDMTPISRAAGSLAVLEAIMGQLYLAVTVARLIGMQISQSSR